MKGKISMIVFIVILGSILTITLVAVDSYTTPMIERNGELKRKERANRGFIMERVRLAAYRIAEEAINNVIKHAKASRVVIKLAFQSEGWIALTIQENGEGFDVDYGIHNSGSWTTLPDGGRIWR